MTEDLMEPITEGAAEGSVFYIVTYNEDRWKRFTPTDQEFCFETWANKARPMGCTHVILKLLPDVLFPLGDNEKPYVAQRYEIVRERKKFTIATLTTVEIDDQTYTKANAPERVTLVNEARALAQRNTPPGGRWRIVTGTPNPWEIEKGRR